MKLNERQACQLLGLAAPTTLEKARKAYRTLAQEFHPDRGGDEERFKQISAAYQYLVDLYENDSRSTAQKTRNKTKAQSKKRTSRKDTYTKSSNAHKTRSQHKTQKTQQKKQHSQADDADHRQAWKDWREQVERSTDSARHSSKKQSTEPPKGRYEKQSQSSQEKTQKEREYTDSTAQTEVVEAAVVPTLGDTLKRWGEEVSERLSGATEGIGQKLNQWYRKSSRSIFEKGTDEKLRLNIDLTTALHGKQVRIAIQRFVPCLSCQVVDGILKHDPNVPAAQWAENCQSCHETGRTLQREELSVYIPPGADRGNKLKVNDKGSAGLNGAPDGHLYLILTPEDLPQGFRRIGPDVELTQAVSSELLSRGGVLPIKTLRGSLNIKVPPNFQSGKKLLIPEQGFPVWSDPQKIGRLVVCLKAIR